MARLARASPLTAEMATRRALERFGAPLRGHDDLARRITGSGPVLRGLSSLCVCRVAPARASAVNADAMPILCLVMKVPFPLNASDFVLVVLPAGYVRLCQGVGGCVRPNGFS